jgi:hypothetical protein
MQRSRNCYCLLLIGIFDELVISGLTEDFKKRFHINTVFIFKGGIGGMGTGAIVDLDPNRPAQ